MEIKVRLADNNEYTISTLNVGDLIEVEKKYGSTVLDTKSIEQMIYWVYLAIKKTDKDITIEKLYELIDAPFITQGGMTLLFDSLAKVNGWDRLPKNVHSPEDLEEKV